MTSIDRLMKLSRGTGTLAIDVGAFSGEFSLQAASRFPQVAFVAVEPVPALAAALRERSTHLQNYSVVECAVAGSPGEQTLRVPSDGRFNFSSLRTLSPDRTDWLEVALDAEIVVAARTLADIVSESGVTGTLVVKIDTQGTDLDVLSSLGPELGRLAACVVETAVRRRHLLYEGSPTRAASVKAIRELGFEVVDVRSEHPSNHDQNLVFVRRDLSRFWLVWRIAYPLLVARAWLRFLPVRIRVRLALRTRMSRILGR